MKVYKLFDLSQLSVENKLQCMHEIKFSHLIKTSRTMWKNKMIVLKLFNSVIMSIHDSLYNSKTQDDRAFLIVIESIMLRSRQDDEFFDCIWFYKTNCNCDNCVSS